MHSVLLVAKYTAKEIYQSKVFVNILFIGLTILLFSYVAAELTYGSPQKISLDFGIGLASLAANGIAIFLGVTLIANEVESRTIYMILSKPITRSAFILGKVLGMLVILFINIITLYILSITIYLSSFDGVFSSLMVWVPIYITLEATIILLAVMLFSILVSKTLAVLVSIPFLVLSHALVGVLSLPFVLAQPWLKKIVTFYSYILPDLSRLNIKRFVIYQKSLSNEFLFSTLSYAGLYALMIVVLIVLIFRQKDLD